jgi:3-hydroxyisobutyrate dehydrogenase-like beta-hydroxyacid dehydrogenase
MNQTDDPQPGEFKIGLVGLGAMGRPIAERLLRAGYELRISDISAVTVEALVKLGAIASENLAELAAKSDVVFVSLPTAQSTEQVITGPDGLIERMSVGGIIVDLGTMPMGLSIEWAKRALLQGKQMLDAPLSGGTQWAQDGILAMMVGGDEPTFRHIVPLLRSFASKIHYIGKSGNGQLLKICHQLAFFAAVAGISEAIAFGEHHGQKAADILRVFDDCIGPRHIIDYMLPFAVKDEFDRQAGTLTLARKDLAALFGDGPQTEGALPIAMSLIQSFDQILKSSGPKADLLALVDLARERLVVRSKQSSSSSN